MAQILCGSVSRQNLGKWSYVTYFNIWSFPRLLNLPPLDFGKSPSNERTNINRPLGPKRMVRLKEVRLSIAEDLEHHTRHTLQSESDDIKTCVCTLPTSFSNSTSVDGSGFAVWWKCGCLTVGPESVLSAGIWNLPFFRHSFYLNNWRKLNTKNLKSTQIFKKL